MSPSISDPQVAVALKDGTVQLWQVTVSGMKIVWSVNVPNAVPSGLAFIGQYLQVFSAMDGIM
jgi:hypothetical protein